MNILPLMFVALALSSSAEPDVAPARHRVLVMDLRADGVDSALVRTVQSSLTTELSRVAALEIISAEDVKNLAELDSNRQLAGCESDSCLAEIANALGAEAAVFGSVGKLGALTVVNVSLLLTATATAAGRADINVEALEELPEALIDAVPQLVGSVLREPERAAYLADASARREEARARAREKAAVAPPTPPTPPSPSGFELAGRAGPPIYVLEPKIVGMASSVGATVASTLARVGEEEGLGVFTRDDAAAVLNHAADLQVLGADADGVSLSALGKKVGARHVLACVVSAVDDDVVVQARLIDVENAAVVSLRETKASQFNGGFLSTVEAAARLVIAPIFADQKGTLTVIVNEEGANVIVDDKLVGVSPLTAPLSLSGGHHMVEVKKEGFIHFGKTIKIHRGAAIDEAVTLSPSAEFLEHYRSVNGTMRTVAWVSTGTGLALGAGAAGLWWGYLDGLGQIQAVERTFAAKVDPASGKLLPEDQPAYEQERSETRFRTSAFWNGAVATSVAAVLLGVGAATLHIVGDDPDRYESAR